MDIITYALSKKYTDETAIQFGGLKGAPCKIKSITKQDGQNIIVFEWKNDEGETRESTLIVDDGTPIYTWTSGDTYHYGDLVIYESAFYRCIVENSDVTFDDTKWNEIGSPDGNYDIIQRRELLPARFTPADRKMYYSIEDGYFWLWNGSAWAAQETIGQYTVMPNAIAKFENKIILYKGATTVDYKTEHFYTCKEDAENPGSYIWKLTGVVDLADLGYTTASNQDVDDLWDGHAATIDSAALTIINNTPYITWIDAHGNTQSTSVADASALLAKIGDLTQLLTTRKSNLVEAINEIYNHVIWRG